MLYKFVFLLCLTIANAIQGPMLDSCPGNLSQTNLFSDQAKLLTQIPNGELYTYQNSQIQLVSLSGTAEEMGTAAGKLMKDQIQQNIKTFEQYMNDNIKDLLISVGIPEIIASSLGTYSVYIFENLLSLNWTLASPFINKRFKDELKGMASGSGVDYETLRNFNMVQELVQGAGASSFASTWPSEDVQVEGDKFYTFRGLDWPANTPVNSNSLVTVYNSSEEGSIPFTNIGYAGIIGAVTVVNSKGVSITEKVWVDLQEKQSWTYLGTPFSFVLRDLAQFGTTTESLVSQIYEAKRTARIYVGLGSEESNEFEVAEYSQKVINMYNYGNYTHYSPSFPKTNGIMFMNQYTYPNNNMCFEDIFQYYLDERCDERINQETMVFGIPQIAQTGISQIVVSDIKSNVVYVAYAKGGQPAYTQPSQTIDLNKYYE